MSRAERAWSRHGGTALSGGGQQKDLPLALASLQIFSAGTSRLRVLCWHRAAVRGQPASCPRCPEGTGSRTTSSFLAPQPCRPPNGWVLGSMALSKLRIFLINNTENNTFISKAPYAEYHSDSEYHLVLIKTKSSQYTLSPQESHITWKSTQTGVSSPLSCLEPVSSGRGGGVMIKEDNAQRAITV